MFFCRLQNGLLVKSALLIKPSTLLRCHRALTELKLKWLFSSGRHHKPGSKGPKPDIIEAIVEFKRRNPRLGCRKIAQQLAHSFGIILDTPEEKAGRATTQPFDLGNYRWQSHCHGLFELSIAA